MARLYVQSCQLLIQSDVRRLRSNWNGVLSVTKGGRVLVDASVLSDTLQDDVVPEELRSWQFNPFSRGLDDLISCVVVMFRDLGLLAAFEIGESVLRTFALTVQLSYQSNPYHNWVHAFDVTHAVYVAVTRFGLSAYLRPLDLLALMLAALCHDVGHPGVNNAFLVASESPLALLYNDVSVLENHHAAMFAKILAQSECNVLRALSEAERRELRKLCITSILATDMANHGLWVDRIASHLKARERGGHGEPFEKSNGEHRELLHVVLLKFCDISNVFKDTSLMSAWMDRITREYFLQGDEMRRRGMAVPDMCDRTAARPREQITLGFMQHVAGPFFERCVAPILAADDARMLRENLESNEALLRSASTVARD